MSTHSGGVAGHGHGLIFCLVMRILLLCAVLSVPIVPGFVLAQENPADREMCLALLPFVAKLRPDLVGPLNLRDVVGAGLSVVAHTRRREALNCVFRYDKPVHSYIHILFFFESKRLFAVRLTPTNAGSIDMGANPSK